MNTIKLYKIQLTNTFLYYIIKLTDNKEKFFKHIDCAQFNRTKPKEKTNEIL